MARCLHRLVDESLDSIATFHDADQSTSNISYNSAGLPDTTTDEDDVYQNYEYYTDFARLYRTGAAELPSDAPASGC